MKRFLAKKTLSALTLFSLGAGLSIEAANGPDYVPPFEVKQGARQDAVVSVQSFLDKESGGRPTESASLIVGNKRATVREMDSKRMTTKYDNTVSCYINDETILKFVFVGSYQNKQKQWTSFTSKFKPENIAFKADKADKSITWSNAYRLPDGNKTAFSYKLKSLGNSKIALTWDIGCSEEQVRELRKSGNNIGGITVYVDITGKFRDNGIVINGKPAPVTPEAELRKKQNKKVNIWSGRLSQFEYNPAKPINGMGFTCKDGLSGSLSEVFHYNRIDLGFQFIWPKPQGEIIIDFGETAVKRDDLPPPVEGHDMWKQNALHIPLSPTRNMFPNPSFEQGLRYWRWWNGGAYYTRAEVKRFDVDTNTSYVGKNSMVINPVQTSTLPLRSFSLAGKKGQSYTVSFYAKAERSGATIKLAPFSSKDGGQFSRTRTDSFKSERLTSSWKRYFYSFVSDGTPTALILMAANSGGRIWLDGIQYERGKKATEFVSSPLEGLLVTSDPDNNLELGAKIDAQFKLSGKSGVSGKVEFTLIDFFKKTLWENSMDVKAGETVKLPFDSLNLATGNYVLRVKYTVNGVEPYYDFYRFCMIKSLNGSHATKDLYGNLLNSRDHRVEDRLVLLRRLGFGGSTSYGSGKVNDPMNYELRDKFGIVGYTHELVGAPHLTQQQKSDRHPDMVQGMKVDMRLWRRPAEREKYKAVDNYSPEFLAQFEKYAEKVAKLCPYVRVWSIATEEEGTVPCLRNRHDFDEFAKLQLAFQRGIKRGNPKVIVLPSGGTSGYGKVRGKTDIEGYLRATQGKVKWDAVAVHPYGSIDGTQGATDLDESIQMLSDSIAKFGYGKETPILLNEGGGGDPAMWGDGPDYTYSGGTPSYDIGLHEFLHAAKFVRQYVICLKYWPRLPHFNSWQGYNRTMVDVNLVPYSSMLGINALANILGNPKFMADLRPAPGMRGYAFKDDMGRGVAALWCTIDDVENGFSRGPVMRVKFSGTPPEMFDMMGKAYELKAGPDGYVDLQLTPAPFFLRGNDPDKLIAVLKDAEIGGAGSNVKLVFNPTLDGSIAATVENLTGHEQRGSIKVAGCDSTFKVAGKKTTSVALPGFKPEYGKMYRWNKSYQLTVGKEAPVTKTWNMDYFYVPKISGKPDWNKIPGIRMTNMFRPIVKNKMTPGGHKGDISATFRMAWDDKKLYLRVEAEDDLFKTDYPKFWGSQTSRTSQLYLLDGCLETYLDCAANGRLKNGGFDMDDYRYDFCVGNAKGASGRGLVYRLREVFNEYAGGVEFPTKAEAARGVKCDFIRKSRTKYVYNITYPQRYIAPFVLKKGNIAGFGLYLHDRMDDGKLGDKGLSLATESGSHCDSKPQVWPLMILGD